jgi:hypothetical protein
VSEERGDLTLTPLSSLERDFAGMKLDFAGCTRGWTTSAGGSTA